MYKFLLDHDFVIRTIDKILFKFTKGDYSLLVHIYVYDTIFSFTNPKICEKFSKLMQDKFEMMMMEELTFFLGRKVKQLDNGIFINQEKNTQELLMMFGIESCVVGSTA